MVDNMFYFTIFYSIEFTVRNGIFQVGGGINLDNASSYLAEGASHVIVSLVCNLCLNSAYFYFNCLWWQKKIHSRKKGKTKQVSLANEHKTVEKQNKITKGKKT